MGGLTRRGQLHQFVVERTSRTDQEGKPPGVAIRNGIAMGAAYKRKSKPGFVLKRGHARRQRQKGHEGSKRDVEENLWRARRPPKERIEEGVPADKKT